MLLEIVPSRLNADLVKALIRLTDLQHYISRHEEIQGVSPKLEIEYIWAEKLSILYDHLVPYYLTGFVGDSKLGQAVHKLRRIIHATEPYARKRNKKDLLRPEKLFPLPQKKYEMIPLAPEQEPPFVAGKFKASNGVGKFLITAISTNGQRLSSQLVILADGTFTEYTMVNEGELVLQYDVKEIIFGSDKYIQLLITGHNLLQPVYINIFTYTKFISETNLVIQHEGGFSYKFPLIFII